MYQCSYFQFCMLLPFSQSNQQMRARKFKKIKKTLVLEFSDKKSVYTDARIKRTQLFLVRILQVLACQNKLTRPRTTTDYLGHINTRIRHVEHARRTCVLFPRTVPLSFFQLTFQRFSSSFDFLLICRSFWLTPVPVVPLLLSSLLLFFIVLCKYIMIEVAENIYYYYYSIIVQT